MKMMGIPIRLKIMMSLLVAMTLVVIVIIFVMANFFHEDKQSYMNDWVSITALSTAQEARSVFEGYAERMQRYAQTMRTDVEWRHKEQLLQGLFDDFPELVHIVMVEDREPGEPVVETQVLESVGLTAADIDTFRAAHPIPFEQVTRDQPFVRNSTIAASLPTMTLAVRAEVDDADAPAAVVVAEISLDELLQVGKNHRVFEILLVTTDGTLLAHPDAARVAAGHRAQLADEAMQADQAHRAGMTLEFGRDGTEMIGGYAGAGFGVVVAAHMPKAAAYLASRTLLSRLTFVAAALLVVVGVGARIWARRITRPMERLSKASAAIAKGEFDVQVEVKSRDEIGALAGSFNQMAFELKNRDEELHVAHQQLIQSEKMSAFGQIGAGIAHEVKNPLAGILGCAQLSLLEVEPGSMVATNLEIIEKETARCKKIIENLMRFARQEDTELEPTDVNQTVRDAVAIVNHQLEMNCVRVHVELSSDLPLISGNANQLQQVLMNLMINAQQAMGGESGTVTVTTRRLISDEIQIQVTDSGPGIPADIQAKLFDPFFTTKPTGQGTGLGLSVSYGIIQDHKGRIEIESEPGEGATFTITLPTMLTDYSQVGLSRTGDEPEVRVR